MKYFLRIVQDVRDKSPFPDQFVGAQKLTRKNSFFVEIEFSQSLFQKIHNILNWPLQTCSHGYDLALTPLMLSVLIFYMSGGGTYSLKSNDKFLWNFS